jgi:acetolactate synthase-1/2/3 large subunit
MNGAERICATLEALGVRTVFGLPGTQNVVLYDALRRSSLRSVVASDEGAAAFMATGYSRAAGGVGVLTTIPGPGFVYALAGVVEARHDSVPLLWLTLRQPDDGQAYPLQRIDQVAMATPVVKRCLQVESPEQLAESLIAGYREALSGEPGPVLIQIAAHLLLQSAPSLTSAAAAAGKSAPPGWVAPPQLLERVQGARRPVLFVGQGAQGAAAGLRQFAERWRAPVLFTSSGRGVIPDADAFACVQDFSFGIGAALPALIDRSDLVLALGCKFTHNGSAAGRLNLPSEKLVRIDASPEVLAANYPAGLVLCARIEDVMPAMQQAVTAPSQWSDGEIADLRAGFARERKDPIAHEPTMATAIGGLPVARLFAAMSSAFGHEVIYTADAGLHQALTRRYANVVSPRGLLCPSDFQSMGFGLPGAIGAALARPRATVVACVGDGALALSLGELLTAVRESVDLIVVVFNDGAYGLIRRQQLLTFGHPAGTELHRLDYAALAAGVGCSYFPLDADPAAVMQAVARKTGVRLVEVVLGEARSLGAQGAQAVLREKLARALPDGALQVLKRLLRR